MLKLNKETLTELTPGDLASVVGGVSCLAASCITGGGGTSIHVHTTFTQATIHIEETG